MSLPAVGRPGELAGDAPTAGSSGTSGASGTLRASSALASAVVVSADLPAPAMSWRRAVLTGLFVLFWVAAGAGLRPLMLPDEGRYVGVAWEMLRSGDWLTPTLDGLPYFHKPPLFYWITAASLNVFGAHEWAARIAPILGATLATLSLHRFARVWAGERRARATLVALLAQPLVFLGAQFANLDMLVAGCITATIALLAHALLSAERHRAVPGVLAAAYGMAALGVLAKGLIGLVMPALVIGVWSVASGRARLLPRLWSWPGAALFVLVGAPWFVAMQGRFSEFLDYFFVVQHFKRFAAAGFNNVEPFWFYPVVLALCCLPWLRWLPALWRWPRREAEPDRSLRLLMTTWIVVVVLFFSWPASKLVGYVLPALPPLAFLLADAYVRAPATPRASRLWALAAALAMVLNGAVVAWLAVHPLKSSRAVAIALREHRRDGEPVVMLEQYAFDVPFYARLSRPVLAVDRWSSPDVDRHDNWRKELADASRFAPAAARATLLEPADLSARLCTEPSAWLIGAADSPERYPFLAFAQQVASQGASSLWHLDTRVPALLNALGCAGRPSADSAHR